MHALLLQVAESQLQLMVKLSTIYSRTRTQLNQLETAAPTQCISLIRRKHEKFREIVGNSAPELPEFDRKSKKFRQFGVFTKFLSLSKNATLETLSSVKQSESDHD